MTSPWRPAETEKPLIHGSETGQQSSEPLFLRLGRATRPHGVRGELRVQVPVGAAPRLDDVRWLYFGPEATPYELESCRYHQRQLLVKLVGIEDRDAAETLRGQLVQIAVDDAEPLEPDEYYIRQLLGLRVITKTGELLGELVDVITTGANDVYVVRKGEEELLLPAIRDVIREVDLERGEMRVHLLPGLRGD